MTSFASLNGPSVSLPLDTLTLAPFELGSMPSAASRTPALVISPISAPIPAMSSGLGVYAPGCVCRILGAVRADQLGLACSSYD